MPDDARIQASIDLLVKATEHMAAVVSALPQTVATAQPTGGGWTPAQIAYHVGLTSEALFTPTFAGAAPFLEPAPEGFVETFSFDTIPARVQTFPNLVPPAVGTGEGVRKLREANSALAEAMRSMPAERLSQCAKLGFGTLSIQQMAEFAAGHVLRHQAQLDRILPGQA
jgi:hypothetical protein